MTPGGAPLIPGDGKPIGAATRFLLLPLMAYAACGLFLSLAVHLVAPSPVAPAGRAVGNGITEQTAAGAWWLGT